MYLKHVISFIVTVIIDISGVVLVGR